MFNVQSNDRLNAQDQIRIVTSGRYDTPFEREVGLLRQADVPIYTMAVGNVDVQQLTTFHNLAKQPSHFWLTDDFTTYPTEAQKLYNTVCLGAPGPVHTDPQTDPPRPVGREYLNTTRHCTVKLCSHLFTCYPRWLL